MRYIRNHIVCRVLRELGYVEKLGSGWMTVFSSYERYQLATPEILEGRGFVKCILPRTLALTPQKPPTEEDRILSLLHQAETIDVSMVIDTLRISRQTASRRLGKLIAEQKIMRIGKGPAVRYRLL